MMSMNMLSQMKSLIFSSQDLKDKKKNIQMHEWFATRKGSFCYQHNGPGILTSVHKGCLVPSYIGKEICDFIQYVICICPCILYIS